MKPHVLPHMIVMMIGCMAPVHGQNLSDNLLNNRSSGGGTAVRMPFGQYQVPPVERVRGEVSDKPPVFVAQDVPSMKVKTTAGRESAGREAIEILRNSSPRRVMACSRTRGQRYEVASDSLQNGLQMVAAMYRELGKPEAATDCGVIAMSVAHHVYQDPTHMLEFVAREVAANPKCSCEIVKSVISASDAAPETVAAIAETAILAAPESTRLISQCAIAASPGSLAAVQAVLARLDPNAGETGDSAKSAKAAKGSKVPSVEPPASAGNPLDRPVEPPLSPPPVYPPQITEVNPGVLSVSLD